MIAMSKLYNQKPSEIIGLDDEYTAYCFDEACACIILRLQKGETPTYKRSKAEKKKVHYNSFTDMYKNYE